MHLSSRVALVVLFAASSTVAIPSAAPAGPTAECPSFCFHADFAITAAGTATPTTDAAAPADLTLSAANTSADHATNKSHWLDHIDLSVVNGLGPVATPSTSLDNDLLIAGSPSSCGIGADFSACTAGSGVFYADISGTGGVFDGIHQGTFGIQRIVNISGGDRLDWLMTVDICLSTSLNTCNVGSPQEETVELSSNSAGAGSGTLTLPTSLSESYPTGLGSTIEADGAMDAINNIHLMGTSATLGSGAAAPSGTQTVLHLPFRCGTAHTGATAVDRASDSVAVSVNETASNCPTARLAATAPSPTLTPLTGAGSSSPIVGRHITRWRWSFGDGTSSTTSAPTVSHHYAASRNRIVTLVVTDSLGAISSARHLALNGATLTLSASTSSVRKGARVVLRGRLTRWHSTAGLAHRSVTVLACAKSGRRCHRVAVLKTSGKAGKVGTFRTHVRPSRTTRYKVTFAARGFIGTTAARLVKTHR